MNRRNWIKINMLATGGMVLNQNLIARSLIKNIKYAPFTKADFGSDFKWGVAQASYQTEGAWNIDGKGESVWDRFSRTKGKIERAETGDIATDFYHKYKSDIALAKMMNFDVFRFSLSWSRIFPKGIGELNHKGVEFYHKVIDACLAQGLEPWVTIFHWDHPQALEDMGGWTNRKMVDWFSEYAEFVTKEYGSKVKNWMILNEPLSFTGMGYMFGEMAPGRKGLKNFKPAAHHAVLCQAEGGRIVRKNVPGANIGTTFAMSWIDPIDDHPKNIEAAKRTDAVFNRLFIEPALGLGYPEDGLPYLKTMKKLYAQGDEKMMHFDFDFVGVQYYFRTVVKKSWMPPGLKAKEISPVKRAVPRNEMNGEIYPKGFYQLLKKVDAYKNVKKIIVTENGTCVKDVLENGYVHDKARIKYFEEHLAALLKAKNEGVKVDGYFAWSLTDNFEWDKGFRPRFGLVYVDFNTLERTVKDSGYWFRDFLK